MKIKKNIKLKGWKKISSAFGGRLIFLCLFFFFGMFSTVMGQTPTPATLTDFYETISPFSLFDSWSAVSDIHYRGSSFEVDLLSVYLNMNQEQKNEYVQLLKKVQKIEFDLNGDDYLRPRKI